MTNRTLITLALTFAVIGTLAPAIAYVKRGRTIVITNYDQHRGVERLQAEVGVRTVTAYNPGDPLQTDDSPCIGASNKNLCELAKQGIQVCASNEFPFGTVLQVGMVRCVVEDRMNRRYENRIDLAMLDREEALVFGKRNLEIKIIK